MAEIKYEFIPNLNNLKLDYWKKLYLIEHFRYQELSDYMVAHIVDNPDVRESREIISDGFYASNLTPIVHRVGYDAVNAYFMEIIDHVIAQEKDNKLEETDGNGTSEGTESAD